MSAAAVGAPGRAWTVLECLRWTAQHFARQGIETPRLDAECLLAHALATDRLRLYLDFDKPLQREERARYRELVRRRAADRVPVALLTGRREFWSLSLVITPEVLVPRPETETLVQAALGLWPEREAALRVLDVGTGSGAVALALASEWPRARVSASDTCEAALAVARANAERLGLASRLRFLHGSLFGPVLGERFDLVVSNPPYLADAERVGLAPELAHEPERALFAGPRGDELLRALVDGAPDVLARGGVLALEVAPGQADAVRAACTARGLGDSRVVPDLAGRPRVVTARWMGGDG